MKGEDDSEGSEGKVKKLEKEKEIKKRSLLKTRRVL